MTDGQVKAGFDEVYNQFWRKYKDDLPSRDADEWDRIYSRMVELQKMYPFLEDTLRAMFIEFDERMRADGK